MQDSCTFRWSALYRLHLIYNCNFCQRILFIIFVKHCFSNIVTSGDFMGNWNFGQIKLWYNVYLPSSICNISMIRTPDNMISWIFSMISGVVTSFGLPNRLASFVLVRNHLNSPIHFSIVCLFGEDSPQNLSSHFFLCTVFFPIRKQCLISTRNSLLSILLNKLKLVHFYRLYLWMYEGCLISPWLWNQEHFL